MTRIIIVLFIFFCTNLKATEFNLKKILNLNEPWGSSFINENELLITEKSGIIKIINLKKKKQALWITI